MDADGQEPHDPVSGGHPDIDTLAHADAEALDPRATAEVLDHAATCAACTAVLDALRAVRIDLASLPRPPVPAGVAAQLDAVLDAERGGRSGRVGVRATEGKPDPAGNVLAFEPGRARRPRRRWLGWAVAAAVLVSGSGVVGAMALGGGSSGGTTSGVDDTTVAAGTLADPSSRPSGSRQGVPPESMHASSLPRHPGGSVPSYTRDNIEDNLAAILAGGKCTDGLCDSARDDGSSRCASELSDEGVQGTPRAVQFAFFEGTPAFVFVFDDDRIVVVNSDCAVSASPTILFRDH